MSVCVCFNYTGSSVGVVWDENILKATRGTRLTYDFDKTQTFVFSMTTSLFCLFKMTGIKQRVHYTGGMMLSFFHQTADTCPNIVKMSFYYNMISVDMKNNLFLD